MASRKGFVVPFHYRTISGHPLSTPGGFSGKRAALVSKPVRASSPSICNLINDLLVQRAMDVVTRDHRNNSYRPSCYHPTVRAVVHLTAREKEGCSVLVRPRQDVADPHKILGSSPETVEGFVNRHCASSMPGFEQDALRGESIRALPDRSLIRRAAPRARRFLGLPAEPAFTSVFPRVNAPGKP